MKYCLETVSYTHLRAHETKAKLVCRLLLEKKNIRIGEGGAAQQRLTHGRGHPAGIDLPRDVVTVDPVVGDGGAEARLRDVYPAVRAHLVRRGVRRGVGM